MNWTGNGEEEKKKNMKYINTYTEYAKGIGKFAINPAIVLWIGFLNIRLWDISWIARLKEWFKVPPHA